MDDGPMSGAGRVVSSGLSRRRFVRGAAAVGALAGLEALLPAYARAQATAEAALAPRMVDGVAVIDLEIGETPLSIAGRRVSATTINGTVPGPLLHLTEGQDTILRVTNRLREDTSIHWHGVLLPPEMDGVPGVSFPGILAGHTFEYRFPLKQTGTYWYHSHSGLQEQLGHYGPLLILPRGGYPYAFDREHTIVLSDWTFENPHRVLDKLKKQGGYYNRQQLTVGDLVADARRRGLRPALRERLMWAQMRMDPTDILDVTGATYTYLVNGLAPETNWTGLFRPGERVLLHVINASAATYFDVRIPGLPLTVVQSNGQYVQPVETDELRIPVAETYDFIVQPPEARAYTFFAESMDRSGYARGTLAPRDGMSGPIPARRPRPILTMADMGMEHEGGGAHGGHSGGEGTGAALPAGTGAGTHDGGHGAHAAPNGASGGSAGSATPQANGGRAQDHGAHGAPSGGSAASGEAPSGGGMTHGQHVQEHRMPAMESGDAATEAVAGAVRTAGLRPPGTLPGPLRHEADTHGPGNAAVPEVVRSRMSEPGIGLGDDGWRVLTYTQLRSLQPEPRLAPDREIELHLTGNMERFMWSIDGVPFADSEIIPFHYGERIRLTMVNDTMMNHPMHIHGMWMELENGQREHIPRVHTVNVQPAERLSVLITADAPGMWAFHCHILYHMEVGMFRLVEVSEPGSPGSYPVPRPAKGGDEAEEHRHER